MVSHRHLEAVVDTLLPEVATVVDTLLLEVVTVVDILLLEVVTVVDILLPEVVVVVSHTLHLSLEVNQLVVWLFFLSQVHLPGQHCTLKAITQPLRK